MFEFEKAVKLLEKFKGDKYIFGTGVLDKIGYLVLKTSKNVLIFRDTFPGSDYYVQKITDSLEKSGIIVLGTGIGARPNATREDLFRIAADINKYKKKAVISFGGGSTIDAVKAAIVLCSLDRGIDSYFGTGEVSRVIKESGMGLIPHIAVQTLASSGAHLTKYSNITDINTSQKKLIIDDAIIPTCSLFDYSVTYNTPIEVTLDGAFDGLSHIIEVLYSLERKPDYNNIEEIAKTGIELIVKHLPKVISDIKNKNSRDALCYATDLGGCAIMVGSTNGGHLTSFSLVDILSHGRACAIMNPYYSVFFAPYIQNSLKIIGTVLNKYGYLKNDFEKLKGRDLGISVAKAMFSFAEGIGFPTTLGQVKGFTQNHIKKALTAAKNPQLASKLQNMPVPLSANMIEKYMKPILEAAVNGNINTIKNLDI